MRRSQTQTILVALDLTHQSGREHLSGFYKYADRKNVWEIQLVPSTERSYRPMVEDILRRGVDGIVMKGECVIDLADPLWRAGVPIVSIDRPQLEPQSPADVYVCNDNRMIGQTALRHFDTLGCFASYGFIPDPNGCEWSRVRGDEFCAAAAARHPHVPVSVAETPLRDWLAAQPKPLALFAAFDACAATALKVCRELKLKVPGDVAVLGVDNDVLICDHTRPKLSSINPDHEGQGFAAAVEMDRLLTARPEVPRTVVCPHLGIVERDTTKNVPPAVHLVREIDAYLDRSALGPLHVAEVVRHLGVSARLANLRYSRATGHSIREEIVRRRMKEAHRLLLATRYPIARIARRCGFSSAVVFTHLFVRRFGESPSDFRRRRGSQSGST